MNVENFWNTLQKWQRKVFYLAAFFFAVFVGFYAFSEMTLQSPPMVISQMLAFAATIIALLGFYPRLKETTSTTMNAGLLVSAVSLISILIAITGGLLAIAAIVAGSIVDTMLNGASFVAWIGTGMAMIIFAAAALQQQAISRIVSWMLFAQPVTWAALFGLTTTTGGRNPLLIPIVYGFSAIAMAVIGTQINEPVEIEEGKRQQRESMSGEF